MGITTGFLEDTDRSGKHLLMDNILFELKKSIERDKFDYYITKYILGLIKEAEKLNEIKTEKINKILEHIEKYGQPGDTVKGWEKSLDELQEALKAALEEERGIKEKKYINKKIWEAYQNDLNDVKDMFIALKNAKHILIELLKGSGQEMRTRILSMYTEEELKTMDYFFSKIPELKKAEESIDIGKNIRILNDLTHAEESSFKVFINKLERTKKRKKVGEEVNLKLLKVYQGLISQENDQIEIIKVKEEKKLEIINELYKVIERILQGVKPVQTQANVIKIPTMGDSLRIEEYQKFEDAVVDALGNLHRGYLSKDKEKFKKLMEMLMPLLKQNLEKPFILEGLNQVLSPAFKHFQDSIEGKENIISRDSSKRGYTRGYRILRRFLSRKYPDYLKMDVEHLETWPRKLIMVYNEFLRQNFYFLKETYLPTTKDIILRDMPFNMIYVSFYTLTDREIWNIITSIDRRIKLTSSKKNKLINPGELDEAISPITSLLKK